MTDPRVSVITIFLNEERFLEEAIESVILQSFLSWELLLVDDGSTDGSPAIAQRFAATGGGQIRYLCHPNRANRGMSATRNLALQHVAGEFVAFLDADDVWLPNKLNDQIAIMDHQQEAYLIYGRSMIWYSWEAVTKMTDFVYDLGVVPDRLYRPYKLFEVLLEGKAQTPTPCNALMRRALFDKVGGFEDSFRGMFEDQVFFAKALLGAPAYVDGRVWARYRQHPKSCTAISQARGKDLGARLRFLRWLKTYMRDKVDIDQRVHSALSGELFKCRVALIKSSLGRFKSTARYLIRRVSLS